MANTFIQLNDTPGQYTGKTQQFVRVNGAEDGLSFSHAELDTLIDTEVSGAYAPKGGQVLQWNAGVNRWRPETNDPYSAGNGLIKNAATLDVVATGGLVANSSGVYIEDIANVAGSYGSSNTIPVFTVNTKGQITSISDVALVADSAAELTTNYVGTVAGTVGQIRVTNGEGINANAQIDLVATGVTAATYGNATHAPQITVDTYGRIQNVEMIEMSGVGGNVSSDGGLNYSTIQIAGQTNLAADSVNDVLTLVAGPGIELTTNAAADALTITSDGTFIASTITAGEISDINVDGITDGQVIRWSAAQNAFVPHTIVDGGIELTDLSGSNGVNYNDSTGEIALSNTGVIAGTYGNEIYNTQVTVDATGRVTNISNVVPQQSGVSAGTYGSDVTIPQITVDALGRVTNISNISSAQHIQSLSWNSTTNRLSLSSGNTIDLSALADNGFKTIEVQGKGSMTADARHDALTFVGGAGINLEIDSVTDTIIIENVASTELSGVTAGTYGNATTMPKFTVDNRGRITNVTPVAIPSDLQTLAYDATARELTLSDGNTVDLGSLYNDVAGFSQIQVSGQPNIVAERDRDILTFVGGVGVNITTDPGSDTITINATGSSAANISGSSIADLADVGPLGGITNGQALVWNSTNSRFEPGTVASTGGTTYTAGDGILIGGNVIAVNNTVVRTTGNQTITGQKSFDDSAVFNSGLILNPAGDNLDLSSISAEVDGATQRTNISVLHNDVNSANMALNAELNISASADGSSTINIDADSVNINSISYPSVDGSAGQALITDGSGNLTFGSVASAFGNSDVQAYLNAQGYATQASIVAAITDSAPGTLDTLNELAAALGDDPNFATTITNQIATKADISSLSTVATTGDYADLSNKPVLALSGSNISLDGTVLDLSGVGAVGPKGDTGATGPQGPTGNDGVSVATATVSSGDLIITLSNAQTINAGNVVGPQGQQGLQGIQGIQGATGPQGNVGPQGPQGVQGDAGNDGLTVTGASISTNNLVLTLSDSSTINAGNVRGPVGPQGPQGPQGDGDAGISTATVNGSGNLIVTLNDATTIDAGNVKGDKGDIGDTGIGITSVSLVSSNLVINYSNTSTQDLGNVQGPAGPQGAQGVAGPAGPAGPQGNIGPAGPTGNVQVTTANTAPTGAVEGQMWYATDDGHTYIYHDGNWASANPGESPQTLSLVGNVLTISGSNSNVDLTSFAGGGSSYADSDVDTHLNRSSASAGQVLTWNGSDYAWTNKTVDTDTNTDAQTLSLAGNVITISGSSSTVDLTSALGSVSGGIADLSSNVISDLGDVSNASPTDGQALVWDNANNTWKPGTVAASGGIELTDLSGGTGVDYDNTTGEIALASSGVSAGTYGSSTLVPRITVDNTGRVTSVTTQAVSGGGGGGGSGATVERFKLNYTSSGALNSTSDLTSGIASVSIDSASGGDVTINFNGYNFPPAQILIYGYVYASNKYTITPFESTMGLREIAGGGTAGSPTLFNGSSTPSIKLRLREAETGASRSFGTVTHAWIQFVMYD